MSPKLIRVLGVSGAVLLVTACQDRRDPTGPDQMPAPQAALQQLPSTAQQRAAWFRQAVPEVMALPRTVFADDDESSGLLVFGVEHAEVMSAVHAVLARHGVPASAYRIEVTEPVRFAADLQDEHRPTLGGIRIVFKGFACTLGFNVDQAGERSFLTNSHCSTRIGSADGTDYYQPVQVVPPQFAEIIADEVEDPAYFRGNECSRGKKCRYSDASRALYRTGTPSNQGAIARTSGANNGSIEVVASFSIAEQDDSQLEIGDELHKVGYASGWTMGEVDATCMTVNVFASNVQLLCQHSVTLPGAVLVDAGDSGAPVFQTLGGDDVRLVGILWGGNLGGDSFLFSPLSGIVAELGAMDATAP